MNIRELDNFKLTKAINFHEELNPQLFLNEKMRPDVLEKLKKIANHFQNFLGVRNIALVDITVSGSSVAYTYTPHSDIDLHLVVDFSRLPDDQIYRELFDAKKYQYNDLHNIKIKGYEVELYVQDSDQPHSSLGEYSILKDEWNRFPTKQRANLDDVATKAKYEKLKELAIRALASDDEEYLDKVLNVVKRYRRAGLAEKGEFGPENLAFKVLRTEGYFQKLWAKKREFTSKDLSLEDAVDIDLTEQLKREFAGFASKTLVESTIKRMYSASENIFDNHSYDELYDFANDVAIFEASYEGNIGIMELSTFFQVADEQAKAKFKKLVADGENKKAWRLVQHVTKTHLRGDEFNESVGKIVKGVNTTQDVGVDEIRKQAKKLGFKVTKDGVPPLLEFKMSPKFLEKQIGNILQDYTPIVGLEFEVILKSMVDHTRLSEYPSWRIHNWDDLKDEFRELPHFVDSYIEDIQEDYYEWFDETQNKAFQNIINDPSEMYNEKVEILVNHGITAVAGMEALWEIDPDNEDGDVDKELAKKIINGASKAFKELGPIDGWYSDNWYVDDKNGDPGDQVLRDYYKKHLTPYAEIYYTSFRYDKLSKPREELFDKFMDDSEAYMSTDDLALGKFLEEKGETLEDVALHYGILSGDEVDTDVELENLVSELNDAGVDVQYGGTSTTNWVVTPDSSITPDHSDEFGVEIIMPPMPYSEAVEEIEWMLEYLTDKDSYTNDSTGLHMNISIEGIKMNEIDYTKLAVMLGDKYVLQMFGREFNTFAVPAVQKLSNVITAMSDELIDSPSVPTVSFNEFKNIMRQDAAAAGAKITNVLNMGKYISIHLRDNRIEFRGPGGNYLEKITEIFQTLNRIIVAFFVAANPEMYKKEYMTKLYKLIASAASKNTSPDAIALFTKYKSGYLSKEDLIKIAKSKLEKSKLEKSKLEKSKLEKKNVDGSETE